MSKIVKFKATFKGKNAEKILNYIEPSMSKKTVRLSRTEFYKKNSQKDLLFIKGYVKYSAHHSLTTLAKYVPRDGLTPTNKNHYSQALVDSLVTIRNSHIITEKEKNELKKSIESKLGTEFDRESFLLNFFKNPEKKEHIKKRLEALTKEEIKHSERTEIDNFLESADTKKLGDFDEMTDDGRINYTDLTSLCKSLSVEAEVFDQRTYYKFQITSNGLIKEV